MQRRALGRENQDVPHDDAALFDRYGLLIFVYILKHVNSREDAEDLTLEVFTAALEKQTVSQLRPEEQLAWLKGVTHNKLIDTYRKAQHRQHTTIDLFADLLPDDAEPEQLVLQREADEQLHQYIQQLPVFQQQLLYLRYVHNLSTAEIGVLLKKNEATIRQQLSRTRKLLRTSYLGQEERRGY